MPIFVVGLRLWFIPFGGGGLVWLTAIFPWLILNSSPAGLVLFQPVSVTLRGLFFRRLLVVGETSTESLILAQDERWRRA